MSKRYKLHKRADLIEFVQHCNKVISKMPLAPIPVNTSLLKELMSVGQAYRVFDKYNSDLTLWRSNYSLLLSPKAKATFNHYRDMDIEKRFKKLSKPMRIDK